MRRRVLWLGTFALAVGAGVSAALAEVRFTAPPAAVREGAGCRITFAVSAPTDVEVAVLNAKDKVVRHLAAGVLGGENPPPPPLRAGLAQSLTWDGKGDWNAPPGTGPFTVRVRLGMGVRFGRTIGDSPHNFNETVCRGLAVDPKNGDLYVMAMKTRDSGLYFLRVYDRTGKYLRELMPYPAGIDEKSRQVFGSVSVPDSNDWAPMNWHSLWPTFYPVAHRPEGTRDMAIKLMAIHPGEESVVLLAESFASLYRLRKGDGGAVADPFAERLWAKRLAGSATVGPAMGAFGPDGKTIYFAGYAGMPKKGEKQHADWPQGRIYRTAVISEGYQTETFADVPLPEDAPPAQNSWNVLGNAQALHGVAVDKAGRIFVCDAAGGKVWVYAADGKVLGSAAVPAAYAVAVDDRTGALYVLTRVRVGNYMRSGTLVKLSGWDPDARVVASLDLRGPAQDPWLAGDFTQPVAQLWVSGAPRENSLLRILDQDGKLTVAEDLTDRGTKASGFACRLEVDPETDLVYVHNGWAYVLRYNGLTGEYAGQLDSAGRPKPLVGSEFCIRRDGMVYLSGHDYAGGGYSGPFRRLNRDLTEAPLPDGRKQFSDRYGKMGGGYFGNMGSCVTPDGFLYYVGMFTFRVNAVFEVNPDGSAGRCPRVRDAFAANAVSSACTKAGFTGALIGWLQDESGGIDIDQERNLYVGVRMFTRDYKLPDALAPLAKSYRHFGESLGSVIKFRPSGGGAVPDSLKPGTKYKPGKNWEFHFTIPEALEPGLKMNTGQRMDWYVPPWTIHMEGALKAYPIMAPFSNQCACQTPRFEVDDYGRLFIPNALTCTVQVLDNEGNLITRFGKYGNADSQGPESKVAAPAIPLAYPVAAKTSLNHIYVADSANRRVVRVDPVYAAEATCEVK